MPPTLASLVQHSALKLTVRAGGDRLDTPVRWAHVSELADPVPYMEGGELLLITALKLDAEDPGEMRRYVRRLAKAGVVGLGFAVGVHYDDIPDALLDAARDEDFPLLAVPRRTPFIAISKAVSEAIARDQYRAVTAGFAAQRELTRRTLADGPEGLLAVLATQVDGWAALYDASGAVVAAAPEWAARRAARLTADVARLGRSAATASAVVGGAEDRVELHPLGTGRRPRSALAVGTASALGTAERYAVHSAIALLTLTTERSRALHAAEERIGTAVLRLLLAARPDDARAVAGDLYGALLDAPFRIAVAVAPAGSTGGAGTGGGSGSGVAVGLAEAVESAAARAGEPVLLAPGPVEPDGPERLTLVLADGGAAAHACAGYTEGDGAGGPGSAGLVIGVSPPVLVGGAPEAHQQAEQALAVARRRGRSYVEHEEVAAGSVLPLLADDAVRAFADGLLRALREHDATGRGDLVASLRAWLSRHGQWDAAAADLGVHRHTLRYRMRRVEEILGRSLDDPDVRMELWLALKIPR
ncbi:PucR family transcriptional regulator [Streptomyces uncialis]|uniref:PucR family transcriptional regulator n=1 Tax=Streptomyces uncialis TaxID=1048205 RepID=UPI003865B0E9|nr:PucR family transcriptional regulator [Streptomyces uncialis]